MPIELNRRQVLASTLAAMTAGSWVGALADARAGAPTSLVVQRRTIDVRGRAASVFGITGPGGESGLLLQPADRFLVNLENRSAEPTVVHWHGQTPPDVQDGVVETGSALIVPGAAQPYDFPARGGTHWMHSHHGLQEQLLLAAPLIVRTAEDLRLDAQEVTILLHDFSFRPPEELFAQLGGGMTMPMGGHLGHGMSATMHGGTTDLNDIDYDAYLANDRTLQDPLVVRTERNGRVRLRLINAAASTAFWIDLGATEATAIAVDGDAIQPVVDRRFPLAQGQRLDLLLRMPAAGIGVPVLAQREGDRQRTGFVLAPPGAAVAKIADVASTAAPAVDLSFERRLVAAAPLRPNATAVRKRITLTGSMMPYGWSIDGRTWDTREPLLVVPGQRVVLEMANRSVMAHPMHLHGHHFQVVAIDGRPMNGALRDTVLVPVNGTVVVAFDADNPGRWLLHCHNLYHMAGGMMTELVYDRSA